MRGEEHEAIFAGKTAQKFNDQTLALRTLIRTIETKEAVLRWNEVGCGIDTLSTLKGLPSAALERPPGWLHLL